jgi:hypothetical protein
MTRIWATALGAALAISALLLASSTPLADNSAISLEVEPGEIELCGQSTQTFQVMAYNNGATPVSDLKLELIHDTRANFTPAPAPIARLAAGSSAKWIFSAAEPQDGVVAGKVYCRLEYRSGKKEGTATAQLEVKQRSREALAQVATAAVSLASSALDESQPVNGYLTVTNPSAHSLEVEIVCPTSDRLTFDFPALASKGLSDCSCINGKAGPVCKNSVTRKFDLTPGEAVPVPIRISTKNGAVPGKRKIAFQADLSWNDRGCAYTATLVATEDLEVGIFGQSEILTALGIPSLLVLPGVLVMLVVGMLWKAGVRFGQSTAEFPYQTKTPEFWLFAVSLSFVAVLLGRWVFQRPYLNIYQLSDLMWLWFLSVLFGALAFVAADIVWSAVLRARRRHEEREKPLPDDDPRKILEKLGRLKKGVYLPRLSIRGTNTPCFRFFAPRQPPDQRCWVVPRIVLKVRSAAPAGTKAQVDSQRGKSGDPGALAKLITDGAITGRWQISADLAGPKEIDESDLQDSNVTGPLIDAVEIED